MKTVDRGVDVVTEKPMVTELDQCPAVLDAERRNKRKVAMAFNSRYAPKSELIWQRVLRSAAAQNVERGPDPTSSLS